MCTSVATFRVLQRTLAFRCKARRTQLLVRVRSFTFCDTGKQCITYVPKQSVARAAAFGNFSIKWCLQSEGAYKCKNCYSKSDCLTKWTPASDSWTLGVDDVVHIFFFLAFYGIVNWIELKILKCRNNIIRHLNIASMIVKDSVAH